MPSLTDELSTTKEQPLNQFGMAVSVKCGKSSTESVELLSNLTLTRHTVRRLNQMSRQGRFKVELIQFCSTREKYGVIRATVCKYRPKSTFCGASSKFEFRSFLAHR